MGENGLTVADALALQNRNGTNQSDTSGLGGGQNAWWVIILILFFAFAGWGNGRNSGNENGGTNTVVIPAGGGAQAQYNTQHEITDEFNFNTLNNGIRGVQNGLCQGFYTTSGEIANLGSQIQQSFYNNEVSALQGNYGLQTAINQGNNGIQNTLNCGFNGIQSAIAQTNYNMKDCCCETREAIMQTNFNNQNSFNNTQYQMQQGFCGVQNGQEQLKYALAQSTCDIITNADKNTDRIINHMVQSEMDNLRTQLQTANFQLSQLSQTSTILSSLNPTPVPAFPVAPPTYYTGAFNTNTGCC